MKISTANSRVLVKGSILNLSYGTPKLIDNPVFDFTFATIFIHTYTSVVDIGTCLCTNTVGIL